MLADSFIIQTASAGENPRHFSVAQCWTMDSVACSSVSESAIAQISDRIMRIVSPERYPEWENALESLSMLPQIIEEISKRINYDYRGYENRLFLSDQTLQKIFENKILANPTISEIIDPIREAFQQEPALIANPKIWETFRHWLYRTYFEDLTYESVEWEYSSRHERILVSDDFEGFVKWIRECQEEWERSLRFRVKPELFSSDPKRIVELARRSGRAGAKILSFSLLNSPSHFDYHSLPEFIREAGKSGIRFLDLSSSELWEIFKTEGVLPLVQLAGEAGIRELNLGSNFFWDHLDIDELCRMVGDGVSGLKVLHINHDNFYKYYDNPEELSAFIIKIGQAGVRVLNVQGSSLPASALLVSVFSKPSWLKVIH